MSLNSFNSSISSVFSFSVKLELIETGLGSYESDPKLTSSNSSSADKHSIPALEAMLTRASVAIFLFFTVSPIWSNKFLNLELYCKLVIAAVSRAGFSSTSSPGSAYITTAATPFPL